MLNLYSCLRWNDENIINQIFLRSMRNVGRNNQQTLHPKSYLLLHFGGEGWGEGESIPLFNFIPTIKFFTSRTLYSGGGAICIVMWQSYKIRPLDLVIAAVNLISVINDLCRYFLCTSCAPAMSPLDGV